MSPSRTQRRLILVRHGKAERDSATGLDRDRPLRPRGHRQAAWLGQELLGRALSQPMLVSSEAIRARETAEGLASVLGLAIRFDDRLLVDEPASGAIELIESCLQDASTVIVVGHNPQISRLVSAVQGRLVANEATLRTGEAAVIVLGEGGFGTGSLEAVLRMPRGDE
ncbi:MAG: SixA phosphatase family protein [Phycisphaerales bacterium]